MHAPNVRPYNSYVKYVCFTLNNPGVSGAEYARKLGDLKSIKAFVFQLEKGSEGTPHFQGYLEMGTSRTFSLVKKLLGGRVHLEKRKGSPQQAIEYCKKCCTEFYKTKAHKDECSKERIDGPWENGDFTLKSEQGRRTDLEKVVQTIQDTNSLREVVRCHPTSCIRYSKGIQFVYTNLKAPTSNKVPRVVLYYGETGTGKTRCALSGSTAFKKSGSNQWFDGYDNEDTLVIDDFGGKLARMPLTDLLVYLDRYAVKLPVKGSFVDRNCSRIIVTTNIHPRQWYDYSARESHYAALKRRFSEVIYFTMDGAYTQDKDQFFDDYVEFNQSYLSTDKQVSRPWDIASQDHIEVTSQDDSADQVSVEETAIASFDHTSAFSIPAMVELDANQRQMICSSSLSNVVSSPADAETISCEDLTIDEKIEQARLRNDYIDLTQMSGSFSDDDDEDLTLEDSELSVDDDPYDDESYNPYDEYALASISTPEDVMGQVHDCSVCSQDGCKTPPHSISCRCFKCLNYGS